MSSRRTRISTCRQLLRVSEGHATKIRSTYGQVVAHRLVWVRTADFLGLYDRPLLVIRMQILDGYKRIIPSGGGGGGGFLGPVAFHKTFICIFAFILLILTKVFSVCCCFYGSNNVSRVRKNQLLMLRILHNSRCFISQKLFLSYVQRPFCAFRYR